jgi:hypothetical protein
MGVFGAVALGAALASPAAGAVITLFGGLFALGLILWLPPHLFLGGSLALLGLSSGVEPMTASRLQLYPYDLALAFVLVRAMLPRERRSTQFRVLDAPVALPLALWMSIMVVAGIRGFLDGNDLGAIARLETPLVYFPLFCWGFIRILGETSVSVPRVIRILVVTSLSFVAYAAFARITHYRFGEESGSGIGAVETTTGVLRRDYGLFSAFEIYALLAVGGLAYLIFSQRTRLIASVLAGVGLVATLLTLVRGLIFGVVAGATWLLVESVRTRWHAKLVSRLLPLVTLLAIAGTVFFANSPVAARGVTERFLPGITRQTEAATQNTEYRAKAIRAGATVASNNPFGLGFVRGERLETAGYLPLYVPHSQWGALLAYTGWPGLLVLGWVGLAVVRRSFQLPAAAPWLNPLVAATALLVLVQGFGWDVLFSQPWSLGMISLVLALRFGLRTDSGPDSPERSA